MRPLHNVASEGNTRKKNGEIAESVCPCLWVLLV